MIENLSVVESCQDLLYAIIGRIAGFSSADNCSVPARLRGIGVLKLWLLQPVKDADPWMPFHDCMFGFVVRADSEAVARSIAATRASDEGPKAWLSSQNSSCVELQADEQPGVILESWNRPK
jgi:hypothetical protein